MLTTAPTQVGICNQALARCGIKQFIAAITDASQEAVTCALFWDGVRQRLLSAFPWKFAQRAAELEAFTPRCSDVARTGTGPTDFFTAAVIDTVLCVGTFNIMVQVTTSGGAGAGKIRASADGGITWGAITTYSAGAKTLGSADLPVGDGLDVPAATIRLTLASGKTLVAGDLYRVTATDGKSPEYQYAYELPDDVLVARYLYPGIRAARADQRLPWRRGAFPGVDVLWTDVSTTQTPTLVYVEDVLDASRFTPHFADALAWKLAGEIAKPLKAKPELDARQEYLLAVNEARSVDFIEGQEDTPPDSETIAARGDGWSPYGVGNTPPWSWYSY